MSIDVDCADDPRQAMRRWYTEASQRLPRDEAHRVSWATVDADGVPNVRIVLCREIDKDGALFVYTNYLSAKGEELRVQAHAALVFHWASLGRQLRVRGRVLRTSGERSDAYWKSRPRDSQLSALCSPQSRPIESLAALVEQRGRLERELGEHAVIPRPDHWGGYALTPTEIEFWQEGQARFHERIRFVCVDQRWTGHWVGA